MWDCTVFFSELAATVIGVGLGVPLGLWLNRRASKLQRRQEEERIKQRRLWLLKALQEEVGTIKNYRISLKVNWGKERYRFIRLTQTCGNLLAVKWQKQFRQRKY